MQFDLEDRTKKFSIDVIKLVKQINITPINQNIISQLLKSAASVGANYHEANNAASKKDFKASRRYTVKLTGSSAVVLRPRSSL